MDEISVGICFILLIIIIDCMCSQAKTIENDIDWNEYNNSVCGCGCGHREI